MSDSLLLSAHSSTPMYAQIMEQIVAKIMAGDWRAGEALPSIRALASDSQVSVITVKRAYLELERAGVIVTRQGKGSFVADAIDATRTLANQEFQAQLKGLLEAARKLGMNRDEVLRRVADALRGDPGAAASESDQGKQE